MKVAISVIIPVRNEASKIGPTIRSIARSRVTDEPCEIVVVDDASTDEGCKRLVLSSSKTSLRIVRSRSRLGVPGARNCGAAEARGKVLFITDSHVRFVRGWDKVLLNCISDNLIVAATIADTRSAFRGYGCSLVVPFMGTRWNRDSKHANTAIQIASAAGTGITRELFWRIGGYDTGMRLYGAAEPEISLRAWLSGAKVKSAQELRIMHRFKTRVERGTFLQTMRSNMVHNNLRFGLMYLDDLAALQMIRHYTMEYPRFMPKALRLLESSDVWARKEHLENTLKHDFRWFVDRFKLKDQVGQDILMRRL